MAIATSIERLIDLLDAMSPDPDLEESLGWGYGSQLELHAQDGEREEENEHGGDINDDNEYEQDAVDCDWPGFIWGGGEGGGRAHEGA
ncbi:hypothetical protein [Mesorhizobium sp. M0802]|uniref:hypothetical protein n=1 Tax=Mesorhizobium sp. M0802 TaxID=2957001 RepID=UPI00333AFE6C